MLVLVLVLSQTKPLQNVNIYIYKLLFTNTKASLSNFDTPVTCHNCHDIQNPGGCTKTTTCQAYEVEYPYKPFLMKYKISFFAKHIFLILIALITLITSDKQIAFVP